MIPFRVFLHLTSIALATLSLGACASVTAYKSPGPAAASPKKMPDRIYVADFSAPETNLRVDRSGQKLAEFQEKLAWQMSNSLAKQLDRNLAPAESVSAADTPSKKNTWLVVGQFDRVNQGSRALRATVGFGLGGTKVVTTCVVYDLSTGRPRHLLTIQTSGGSNAAPGTAINLPPIAVMGPAGIPGVLMGAGVGALPGLGADVKRTAREIAAMISQYCYEQGLIEKKQAMKPKQPGSIQIRVGDPKRKKEKPASPPAAGAAPQAG